ncbi:hypothetical protein Goari_020450, partial [Gossypium aridum]|nr:hypothetical protein [Gossypium aridum]
RKQYLLRLGIEESGGEDREGRDEISLLAEELIQLTVKGSKVVPNSKPTLICTVWTEKLYNPESFRAQMKSIWKTKKKFEIQRVGQNLFLIVFELEEDLESIMEGRHWLFHKSIILFNRLSQEVERDQIRLNSSPVWIKIDSYLPEFDKKDLMHAIGVTFGGSSNLKLAILTYEEEKVPEGDGVRSDEGDGTKRLKQNDVEGCNSACSELPIGKPTGRSENYKLECSWIGESTGSKEAMLSPKAAQSPDGLLNGDKLKVHEEDYVCHGKETMEFTGFYGSPYAKNKSATWNLLKKLGQDRSHPWLVSGDFNEIMYYFEKCKGAPREKSRMEAFKKALEECLLEDLRYSGVWFTWERGNLPETNIREKLDRGVANDKWKQLFPAGNIKHLAYSMSDHCPILVNINCGDSYKGNSRFKFEAWWIMEDTFEVVVRDSWESEVGIVYEKLERLKVDLKIWANSIKERIE